MGMMFVGYGVSNMFVFEILVFSEEEVLVRVLVIMFF